MSQARIGLELRRTFLLWLHLIINGHSRADKLAQKYQYFQAGKCEFYSLFLAIKVRSFKFVQFIITIILTYMIRVISKSDASK